MIEISLKHAAASLQNFPNQEKVFLFVAHQQDMQS